MLSRPVRTGLRVSIAVSVVLLGGCASSRATFEPSPFPPAAIVSGAPAPAPEKVWHVVRKGETLKVIAGKYGLSVAEVRKANKLGRRAKLSVGQKLLMPVPPPQVVEVAPDTAHDAEPEEATVPAPAVVGFWLWPIEGNVSSKFGIRHHRGHAGIDITAPVGTTIVATRDGQVTFAGRQGRYGNLIVVEHENGLTSWYAHLKAFKVKAGAKVHQGQELGLCGATGNATGPHLHFEVRLEGKAVDPLTLLP